MAVSTLKHGQRTSPVVQKLSHRELQREATQRLNEFMDTIRNQTSVDLAAKNLGEEGCAYVAEALAFNDRCCDLPLAHLSLLRRTTVLLPHDVMGNHSPVSPGVACRGS